MLLRVVQGCVDALHTFSAVLYLVIVLFYTTHNGEFFCLIVKGKVRFCQIRRSQTTSVLQQ